MPRAKVEKKSASKSKTASVPPTNGYGDMTVSSSTNGNSADASDEVMDFEVAPKKATAAKKTPKEPKKEPKKEPAAKKTSSARGKRKEETTPVVEVEIEEIAAAAAPSTRGRGKRAVTATVVKPAEEVVSDAQADEEEAAVEEVPKKGKGRGKTAKAVEKTAAAVKKEPPPAKKTSARGQKKKEPEVEPEPEPEPIAEPIATPPIAEETSGKRAAKRGRGASAKSAAVEPAVEEPAPKATSKKAATTSKPKKGKAVEDEEAAPPKTTTTSSRKRGQTAKDKSDEVVDEEGPIGDAEDVPKKKSRKADEKKSDKKPEKKSRGKPKEDDDAGGAKKTDANKKTTTANTVPNPTATVYNKADFELPDSLENTRSSVDCEGRYNLKITSWNVAGLRSWLKKDGLVFLEYEEPDIFCLQETKCTTDQMPEEAARIPGYHPYWLCMPGGYAGVAIYSKIMPINVEYGLGNNEFDDVGRIITAEYEKFILINVYVPNSGRKLVNLEARMRWESLFQEFVKKLDARKPLVICGDMNVSHKEIDLANPKANTRNAGFTKEERSKMSELLGLGFVDTFRHLYPKRKDAYTFWTYMGNARSRNVGWRLDYFLLSERLVKRVVENCMRSQCLGSDHCPITLFMKV